MAKPKKPAVELPECLCGHPHSAHKRTKHTGWYCTECPCYAYRTFDPMPFRGATEEEKKHIFYHCGTPPNTPQMTVEQINRAWRREQYVGRREILARQISALEHALKWERDTLRQYTKSTKKELQNGARELGKLRAELAAIPDVLRNRNGAR